MYMKPQGSRPRPDPEAKAKGQKVSKPQSIRTVLEDEDST